MYVWCMDKCINKQLLPKHLIVFYLDKMATL